MSSYNLEFNKDDSVIRAIIVGLLAELKDRLFIYHTTDQESKKINIPFYAAVVGQEGFLLDEFLNDEVSDPSNLKAIGTYDVVPRGIIQLSSLDIDSSSLLNKFVRMEKLKKENNQLKSYSYETMLIPITLSFETKIVCDSFLQMLKVIQSCMKTLYKNNQYRIDLGSYPIVANFMIPESLDMEKLMEFSFSDEKLYNINFTMELSSFIPNFDESTEMFSGNVMEGFEFSLFARNDDTRVDLVNKNMDYVPRDEMTDGLYPYGGDSEATPVD